MLHLVYVVFFFQAEDGIRDLVRSRGLGDVYKRQETTLAEGTSPFINQGVASNRLGVVADGNRISVYALSLIHI